MKRLFRVIAVLFLAAPAGLWLYAAPSVGPTNVSPSIIFVNIPTTITVTSVITDPTLITTGINLIQLNPGSASTILGQLHDDGLNGDAVAGDKTFTLQVTLNETKAGPVQFQVSAAFKGVLQRSLSSIVTVTTAASSTPTISANVSPAPNAAGWNNSNATITFTCADSVSGISFCPSPVVVSTEGASQVISGTARNNAGNTASTSVTINLDKTPPVISTSANPLPNAAGWNNSNVTVSFTCSDSLSGVVSCPAAVPVTSEGFGQSISGTVQDRAGNTASAVSTVNLDKTPPVISASANPLPNAAGWNNSNVTVSFTCSDSLSGVVSCPAAVPVTSEGFGQSISGTVRDTAGNSATAVSTINLDETPPLITANVTPSPNAAGWNNSNVTVSFTCSDSLSGVVSCPAAIPVNTEGLAQPITGMVQDSAGNTANALATVNLDKTPPTIAITSPASGTTLYSSGPNAVSGTESDNLSGIAAVTCNGVEAQLTLSGFACSVTVSTGANSIAVQAVDLAGNMGSATSSVTVLPTPVVTITSPANLSYGNFTPVTVQGTVSDPNATVTINGAAAAPSGGSFSLSVPLVEGTNTLTAVATNAGGNQGSASIDVTLDTTPPHLTIDFPASGSTTTDSTVTVTGTVNDIVVGTVNNQNATVTVNGVQAQVANRSYSAVNLPLSIGANTIQAIGVDRAGNETTTSIALTRLSASQPPAPAIGQAVITESLSTVSGNNQSATIGTSLAAPLVVVLRDTSGNPVPNQMVVFQVTSDSGTLSTGGAGALSAAVKTGGNGQAQVFWTLGQRSGTGTDTVQASSVLAVAPVNFAATALSGGAAQVVVDSGDDQTGVAGQPLTFPLGIVVTDSGHNRIANVPVTFSVTAGGGSLNGTTNQVITTDSDGRALAILTLGSQGGQNNNEVDVTFPGNTGPTVAFTASGKIPGNPANTTISGVVLDNSNNPIPNVTMRLYKTNQASSNNLPQQIGMPVVTNALGEFLIQNAPFGYFKLMADGTTATFQNNTYPSLEYDIVTVAGQDNTVGTPIYLPILNTVNQLCVDATHGGTLTLPQSPGFALTVLPGSATFPGGSRTGCITVSTVNGDKVPMAPGFGQQPRFIVSIQPVGTTFNPPAPITFPNADGLDPRHVTEMYSYDHDLSMFVAIGTGTVSNDGSVIASDPGVGVLKAGWHCGGDPNANGHVADCGQCKIGMGNSCVPDPSQDGMACGKDSNSNLTFNGGADSVTVDIDKSCGNICDPGGSGMCGPSANGYNVQTIQNAVNDALSAIFNNDSGTACIEPTLRTAMQTKLKRLPIIISCKANNKSGNAACAQEMSTGSNILNLFPDGVMDPACGPLSGTLLHELVHGYGDDSGAPDLPYHNNSAHLLGPDCRDRPDGCENSCFGVPGGNPFACLLPPAEISSIAAAGGKAAASEGCGPCVSKTFTYTDANGMNQVDTQTVCPTQ